MTEFNETLNGEDRIPNPKLTRQWEKTLRSIDNGRRICKLCNSNQVSVLTRSGGAVCSECAHGLPWTELPVWWATLEEREQHEICSEQFQW